MGAKERRQLFLSLLVALVSISGCSSNGGYVPVYDAGEVRSGPVKHHVVRRGDTLYSIAFRYGLDYKEIADANNIAKPYTIFLGQKILLTGTPKVPPQRQKSVSKSKPETRIDRPVVKSQDSGLKWRWPHDGEIIRGFDLSKNVNKGVDIRGRLGESVKAAADGVVVYAGGGLRGYGKLVIVKHSDRFLSAYGHNRAILVKEGEKVKGGQVVAEIGSSGADQEMLHFEIRRDGKPEDPLLYLPDR